MTEKIRPLLFSGYEWSRNVKWKIIISCFCVLKKLERAKNYIKKIRIIVNSILSG